MKRNSILLSLFSVFALAGIVNAETSTASANTADNHHIHAVLNASEKLAEIETNKASIGLIKDINQIDHINNHKKKLEEEGKNLLAVTADVNAQNEAVALEAAEKAEEVAKSVANVNTINTLNLLETEKKLAEKEEALGAISGLKTTQALQNAGEMDVAKLQTDIEKSPEIEKIMESKEAQEVLSDPEIQAKMQIAMTSGNPDDLANLMENPKFQKLAKNKDMEKLVSNPKIQEDIKALGIDMGAVDAASA